MAHIDGNHLRHLLLGLATGDALGSTSEFVPRSGIPALYSHVKDKGWPFKQIGGGNFCFNPGDPTDDTEMALCILRSFLKKGSFDPNSIAREFIAWMRSGPNDIGTTTRRTLQICESGGNYWDGGLQFWLQNPRYAANGSLMRNGVIAGMARSLEEAFDFTLKCGMITHYAPLPQICCLAQTYLIWELSRGMHPFDDWEEQFEDTANGYFSDVRDEEIRKWIMSVTEKGEYEKAMEIFNKANWNMEEFNPFIVQNQTFITYQDVV